MSAIIIIITIIIIIINTPKIKKSRLNPIQPNPWVDPTHGQLWL